MALFLSRFSLSMIPCYTLPYYCWAPRARKLLLCKPTDFVCHCRHCTFYLWPKIFACHLAVHYA